MEQIYLCFAVCGDAQQSGEAHQAPAADHAGHVPVSQRRRNPEEETEDRVPGNVAHLPALAGRENLPVRGRPKTI